MSSTEYSAEIRRVLRQVGGTSVDTDEHNRHEETTAFFRERVGLFRAIRALPEEAVKETDFSGGDTHGYTILVRNPNRVKSSPGGAAPPLVA